MSNYLRQIKKTESNNFKRYRIIIKKNSILLVNIIWIDKALEHFKEERMERKDVYYGEMDR
jgi:hypothetical protein